MNVPAAVNTQIPLSRPSVGDEELMAIADVLATGYLGCGPVVERFEERVKALLGAKYLVAVATGSAALHLSLEALHLPPGSGVLVPSLTFASAVQAILMARLRPVFCEVGENLLLDIDDARSRLTPEVSAVMPVHYGGRVCDVSAFQQETGLHVVEDAAHAFGSRHQGNYLGHQGRMVCFSFDPVKTVTCGDGGGIATDDADLADHLRLLRSAGIARPRQGSAGPGHSVMGFGYRYHMNDIAASIGIAQLEKFEFSRKRRQEICKRYVARLEPLPGIRVPPANYSEIVPYNFAVLVLNGKRLALQHWLSTRGIVTGVHYAPNHLQPAFKEFYAPLPKTERIGEQILSLPLYSTMSDDENDSVVKALRDFFSDSRN